MRILHILTGGNIGGIETLCRDYAQYSVHENIMLLLWGEGPLADEMKNNGVEVIHLHASPKNVFGTVSTFIELCRRKKIDVVIAHHAAPMSHLCLMAVKKKIPNIITVGYAHGNAVDMCRAKEKKGLWLRRYILSTSLKKVDKVVAISNFVKESLISYFDTPENKIEVIYNGVNTATFAPNKRCASKELQLIYVGRLIEEKGVQNILLALSKVESDISYHLKIVGDGTYRKSLEQISEKYGLQNKVEFCGNRRDVSKLLQKADVFVHMPDWEEGFGITVIEAMAAGKICIVENSGALPEIVSDGVNGYLIEKGNIVALAKKIRDVAEQINSAEIQQICRNAVLRAKDFSIENFARKLDDAVKLR